MEHFVKAVNHPLLIQLLPPVINSVTLLIINQRIAICQVCNFTEKLKGKHLQMLCRVFVLRHFVWDLKSCFPVRKVVTSRFCYEKLTRDLSQQRFFRTTRSSLYYFAANSMTSSEDVVSLPSYDINTTSLINVINQKR